MSKQKNVKNLIMNVLPDNRPITSLQIVEDYEKCPKNFVPVHRTHDQDSDADLWRETNIFGKRSTRYLCLSKSEGLPEYIVEKLRVCGERECPGEGFSILNRTADTEHKAWRKKQICYRLAKRGSVSTAVTDVILCSKTKIAPEGFTLAGDINGITVCFKSGPIPHRPPPSIPTDPSINELENNLYYMNIRNGSNGTNFNGNGKTNNGNSDDYELIRTSYRLDPPPRPGPKFPAVSQAASSTNKNTGTLGTHTDMDGVPFVLHSSLSGNPIGDFDLSKFDFTKRIDAALDYTFHLEREILCTTKTPNSKNPFFAAN
ncbi:multivesicular body subunit 12A [Contarinia nasturtii]|uniref:multivesicular body subunit 12A n=1 Tax=Contarinia nasturtii TaxID=265458 RepID=UPI0012D39FEC|nr:multivesicular body subunit 12A [Contarinia nasturtii]XP_031621753.1 multivesicular body subunit 12A [Contarinia nasturtii]XP_031621754.1 multivesicular body subunit 12A [Contarinia nasturtii]